MPEIAPTQLGKIKQFLGAIWQLLLPIANSLLSQAGLVKIQPGLPLEVQYQGIANYVRSLRIYGNLVDNDREKIFNTLVGIIRTSVPDFDPKQHEDVADQLQKVTDLIVSFYPMVYTVNPQAISYIQPRSGIVLAYGLHEAFKKFVARSDEEIAKLAGEAANIIFSDPYYMQNFSTAEIAQLAEHAIKNGLITDLETPAGFTRQLANVIKLAAPIRFAAIKSGQEAPPEKLVQLVKHIQAEYPTQSADSLALNLWQQAKLTEVGGIYSAALQWSTPEARQLITMSGSTLDELQKKHQILMGRAADSLLGSAAGAVIRSVKEGLVPLRSPAGAIYRDLMLGRPLKVISPVEIIEALIASGLRPAVAYTLATQRETNKYYLTPSALLSIRATQWNVDWVPRFVMINRMFPGNDPQTVAVRTGMMSQVVAQAGYKNIYEFMALHHPVVTNAINNSWNRAAEFGARAQLVAGEGPGITSYRSWWERALNIMQQVGEGRLEPNILTTLGLIFGLQEPSQYMNPVSGLFSPPTDEARRESKLPGSVEQWLTGIESSPWTGAPSKPEPPAATDYRPLFEEPKINSDTAL